MSQHRFTPKMQSMVSHYLNDPTRNKLAAYKHGFETSGMTVHVISVRASEAFKHPLVAEAVRHVQQEVLADLKIDATWVLTQLHKIASFNISKFLVTDGNGDAAYNFKDATEEDWYCIHEYAVDVMSKQDDKGLVDSKKIRLRGNCRMKALELIGKLTDVSAFAPEANANPTSPEAVAQQLAALADRLPV